MMRLHTLILIYLSMPPLVEFPKDRKTDTSRDVVVDLLFVTQLWTFAPS